MKSSFKLAKIQIILALVILFGWILMFVNEKKFSGTYHFQNALGIIASVMILIAGIISIIIAFLQIMAGVNDKNMMGLAAGVAGLLGLIPFIGFFAAIAAIVLNVLVVMINTN